MTIESVPPGGSSGSSPKIPAATQARKHTHPWRPRTDDGQAELNPFAHVDPDGASPLESPQVRDASEDTAPLQGSKDLSDEDSLVEPDK